MANRGRREKEKKKVVVSDAVKWPSGKISGGTDLMVIKKCLCRDCDYYYRKDSDCEKCSNPITAREYCKIYCK